MTPEHLSDDVLTALVEGGPVHPEAGAHFTTCALCQRRLAKLSKKGADAMRDLAAALKLTRRYPQVAHKTCLSLWEAEEEARTLIQAMSQRGHVEEDRLTHFPPFVLGNTVLSMSDELRQQDFNFLLDLCRFALDQLSATPDLAQPVRHHAGIEVGNATREVACLVRAELGNCLRIRGDFRSAYRHIASALATSRDLSSVRSQGRVHWLAASYCRDARDFERAETLAEASLASFLEAEQTVEADRVGFLLASIPYLKGDLGLAETRLTELLGRFLESNLTELAATHLLAKIHALKGEFFKAGRLLKALRSLSVRWKSSPSIAANTLWLRALIVGGHDNHKGAVQHLEKVVAAFLELESPLDAALAGVDLSYYLLRSGDSETASRTALSSAGFLEAHESDYPETYAATCLFHATVEARQVMERSKYLEFARLLDQTRHRPTKAPKGGFFDPAA